MEGTALAVAEPQEVWRAESFGCEYAPAVIRADFSRLDERLDRWLAESGETSDESIRAADDSYIRATIEAVNADIKEADAARKAIKRAYEGPLKEFESEVRERVFKLEAVKLRFSGERDRRADEWRERRRSELAAEMRSFLECNGAMALTEFLTLDDVIESDWLLKGTSGRKACGLLDSKLERVIGGWHTLSDTALNDRDGTIAEFFRTLDIAKALAYDMRRAADASKVRTLDAERAESMGYRIEGSIKREYALTVEATPGQMDALCAYMRAVGLRWLDITEKEGAWA